MKKILLVSLIIISFIRAMDEDTFKDDPYHQNSDPQFISAKKHFAAIADKVKPNWHILDAGCGTGRLSHWMAKKVPQGCVVGFDKDDNRISTAITKLKTEYADVNNLGFIRENAEKARLKNSRIDLTTCVAALHFMEYQKQKKAMQNMVHNLKPGGILLLTCLETHVHPYEEPLMTTAKEFVRSDEEDKPESYDHTVESLTQLAADCGLNAEVSSHALTCDFANEEEFAGFWKGFLFTIKPFKDIKAEQQDAFLEKAIQRCLEKVPKKDGKIIYGGVPLLRLIATKE